MQENNKSSSSANTNITLKNVVDEESVPKIYTPILTPIVDSSSSIKLDPNPSKSSDKTVDLEKGLTLPVVLSDKTPDSLSTKQLGDSTQGKKASNKLELPSASPYATSNTPSSEHSKELKRAKTLEKSKKKKTKVLKKCSSKSSQKSATSGSSRKSKNFNHPDKKIVEICKKLKFIEVETNSYKIITGLQVIVSGFLLVFWVIFVILGLPSATSIFFMALVLFICVGVSKNAGISNKKKYAELVGFSIAQTFHAILAYIVCVYVFLSSEVTMFQQRTALYLMVLISWQLITTIIINIRPFRQLSLYEIENRVNTLRQANTIGFSFQIKKSKS